MQQRHSTLARVRTSQLNHGCYYRPQQSCGQGNIFTPVCHSFCSQGGVPGLVPRGVPGLGCVPGPGGDLAGTPPRPGTLPGPGTWSGGVCLVPRTWQVHPSQTRYTPQPCTPPGPGTRRTRPGTPPRTRYTPRDQAHPPRTRHTPPQSRYTPKTRYTSQDQVHPPTSSRYASYWNAFLFLKWFHL